MWVIINRTFLFILILFYSVSLPAQKKDHQEFLKAIENENLKSLSAGCQLGQTIAETSLNNTRAYLRNTGILWTDIDDSKAGYEVPKGSGKTNIYSGSLWIGGLDLNGVLKVSGGKFIGSRNFWPGPLKTEGDDQGTTDIDACYEYDRFYKINKEEVKKFRDWYSSSEDEKSSNYENYSIPDIINNWPAHGNIAGGYDYYLAPFWDNNEDGSYNPMDGDYPFFDLDGIIDCGTSRENDVSRLFGDESTWWVYNDNGNLHSSPSGEGIGLEIRAQAFQFSTNDEVNDMSFYNFELVNRSKFTLVESWMGFYVDGDLGYAFDDRIACDVLKGIGYYYNGETIDGDGEEHAYGSNPPAIGFDFLRGPYKDPNGLDDCSSYDANNNLICNDCNLNGSINGLNFGDGIVDNERLGMSRFLAYVYGGGTGCGIEGPDEYYHYLQGVWKDHVQMRYGGNGHSSTTDGPVTHYMFPGDSDPCGAGQNGIIMPAWTDEMAYENPADRRFVLSSGPFTMEPGSVNDVTIGVVWARSYDGDPKSSAYKMLRADDKAQSLFDNCFRIVDGPDAPELTIHEKDNKFIFNIWNKPNSNNYLEKYRELDPFIVCPDIDPECDRFYAFQGYQVWQLRDHSSTLQDAINHNPEKARLVFQCDIKDGVSQLVNHEWNQKMQSNIPRIEVEGADMGISHSFIVEEDLFAKGDSLLVNFKDYYYVAVAYAHNNYQQYDQNNPEGISGQKNPYKAGRKGADGQVKIYRVTPHSKEIYNTSLVTSSVYGDSPKITQIEGHGSGNNILDITDECHDSIMSGPPWRAEQTVYQPGLSPIDVRVIDPISCVLDDYVLKFDSVNYFRGAIMNGKIIDANWFVYNSKGDTVFSESTIARNYDQLIPQWGLSINITQSEIPFKPGAVNNGFLEATMEFADPDEPWLVFVADEDKFTPRNWIRSGYTGGDASGDSQSIYENVLGGTWAPFQQAYWGTNGVSYDKARSAINAGKQRLAPVDIYLTSNRDLWTRSPVIETTDDEGLSIGLVDKFELRASQSVNKWGDYAQIGSGDDTINVEAANYISETGMGWFPGYAIDVATGERLNIVYGESSWLTGDNGADMMWNPSPREGSKIYEEKQGEGVKPLDVFFGGKHYIYIMGHNQDMRIDRDEDYFPAYDEGKFFMKIIRGNGRYKKRHAFKNAMWCAIPMLNSAYFNEEDIKDDPYGFVKNDLKIRIRVVDQYCVDVFDLSVPDSLAFNNNKPAYSFNTWYIGSYRADFEPHPDPLGRINVVPNPYYGSSGYSNPDSEFGVKIINLPKTSMVSVYSLSGNLVRRIIKDDPVPFIHWDLKNNYGIPVSSGIYIIHVDAPGIGEKTLKWMGAMR